MPRPYRLMNLSIYIALVIGIGLFAWFIVKMTIAVPAGDYHAARSAVRQFFDSLDAGKPEQAYRLMSPEYRSAMDLKDFRNEIESFRYFREIDTISFRKFSRMEGGGRITFALQSKNGETVICEMGLTTSNQHMYITGLSVGGTPVLIHREKNSRQR